MIRRPRNDDPMVQRKKPRPTAQLGSKTTHTQAKPSGAKPYPLKQVPSSTHSHRALEALTLKQGNSANAVSGFSSAPVDEVHDYPIVLSKKDLFNGFRFHVARFSTKRDKVTNPVDPRNTTEFVRPVRLHRRDPRAPPAGAGSHTAAGNGEDLTEEQKKEDLQRAAKDAAKDAEAALVAPSVTNEGERKLGSNMKRTRQIWADQDDEGQKARSKLRYEEALPWHLEDFDNKSIWMGHYEAALSNKYVMMEQEADGRFKITPLEKWYKFTQKGQFATLTSEEAEAKLKKRVKETRWSMRSGEQEKVKQELEKGGRGLFIGKWENGASVGGGSSFIKNDDLDADDIDFTEDRFADDEENMVVEVDEDTKESDERIKREQLKANIFDLRGEKENDEQEEAERKEKDAEKKFGKHVKSALKKREKNYIYDDSSDDADSSGVSLSAFLLRQIADIFTG